MRKKYVGWQGSKSCSAMLCSLSSGDYHRIEHQHQHHDDILYDIIMLRLSTGDGLNNLLMPTVEVYTVWWDFDTDTFPSLLLLTFPHHGGILSWWEYADKPLWG